MVDVFLMGTAGNLDDPNRSMWREPIKEACKKHGVTFYDPVKAEWNEETMRLEVEALRTARVIVMAITADTAGIASLAESGWAALSALQRNQAFGLFVDTSFADKDFNPRISQESTHLIDFLFGKNKDKNPAQMIEASRRARKLVGGHAKDITGQFPELKLYIARNLDDLANWAVATVEKLNKAAQHPT